MLVLAAQAARAAPIQEVTSPGGIKAWLVEDHKLPLIAMSFAFRGGVEQDPADKQGLATLSMDLLTEGAGPYDATSFQQQLADHSIELAFGAGRDVLQGTLKTLTSEKVKAFDLLHAALTKPHFDERDIERARGAQLIGLRQQLGNPSWQGRYALLQKIFPNHPYSQRRLGSINTLAAITQDDLRSFAADHLARDNVIIAVAGDISAKDLAATLDQIFGMLPKQSKLAPISEITWSTQASTILTSREGTQTELLFALPGPKRDDPDWYAAEIADYILGSGGFSSRLMQNVREKKGLTYGIDTSLSPMEHGGLLMGEAATDNAKTAEAWAITMDTFHKFYDEGVSDKEIGAAKDYLTGSLPLEMTSTDKIAGILVRVQIDHLGIDYLDRHNDLIRNVSADDIQRTIRKWFNPDLITLSMVGKPEGMSPTETNNAVRE